MLQFNPYFRPTASELLKNPIFDKIRIPKSELKAEKKIIIQHDLADHGYYDSDSKIEEKEAKKLIKSHQLAIVKEYMGVKQWKIKDKIKYKIRVTEHI